MAKTRETNMDDIVKIGLGIFTLIIIIMLVPMVAEQFGLAITINATSDWNYTHNDEMPNPVTIWSSNVSLLMVAVLIIIVGIVLKVVNRSSK